MSAEINTKKIYKVAEVKAQIYTLLENVRKDLNNNIIEKVINSGAIDTENSPLMEPESFVLAKLLLTAYFEAKRPYYAEPFKRELANLKNFV